MSKQGKYKLQKIATMRKGWLHILFILALSGVGHLFAQSSGVKYQVQGVVFNAKNQKPIKEAHIHVFAIASTNAPLTGLPRSSYQTNEEGAFYFTLQANEEYLILVYATGYISQQYTMGKQTVDDGEKISIEIPLRVGDASPLQTLVLDKNTQQKLSGVEVTLCAKSKKNGALQRILYTTDENGSFFYPTQLASTFEVTLAKDQYFSQSFTVRIGNRNPPTTSVLEKIEPGAQIRLDTFFFSVNSDDLVVENTQALQNVVTLLQNNPTLVVEIGCHSDARGDDDYNLSLSQKRADAIVNYLAAQGIDLDRLVAKGYGETQILNECVNGVKCANEKHEENRRIVMTIVGTIE